MWRNWSFLWSLKCPQCQFSFLSFSWDWFEFSFQCYHSLSFWCSLCQWLISVKYHVGLSLWGNTALCLSLSPSPLCVCVKCVKWILTIQLHSDNMSWLTRVGTAFLEDWCYPNDCSSWNSCSFHLCKGKTACAPSHRRRKQLVTSHRIIRVLWVDSKSLGLGTSIHVF